MKISTLGPQGTFSHQAVMNYDESASVNFSSTIWDVFEQVSKGEADLGIVPIENSIAGTVNQTADYLIEFKLKIFNELLLSISHNLVGSMSINDIRKLYVHPQTYEQCELFIRKNLPKAEIIFTSSNGKSAEIFSKSEQKSVASIIPNIAASIYKLKIIKTNVQDNNFNVTRFLVIGKKDHEKTGNDRTSIALRPSTDKPGLLYDILGEFAGKNINLTKIESRPAKGKLGEYIFFIDFIGHRTDREIDLVLKNLGKKSLLWIFGSYPKVY